MDAEKARYVMDHRARLIQDVSAVMPIVDSLGTRVHSELYTEILGEKTRQQQMRILYTQLLQPGTSTICAEFYNAVKEHQPFLLEKNAMSREKETMGRVSLEQDSTQQGTLEERIFDALSELTETEFDDFRWWLRKPGPLEGLRPIATGCLEKANKTRTADLIVQAYTNKGEKIMVNVLGKIKRYDLQEKFGSIP